MKYIYFVIHFVFLVSFIQQANHNRKSNNLI